MLVVALFKSYGFVPDPVMIWTSGNNWLLGWWLAAPFGSMAVTGFFLDRNVVARQLQIMRMSGQAPTDFVALVGPRRALLADTDLPIYAAVPHGDQMLTGCFGLLRACADIEPEWRRPALVSAVNADPQRWADRKEKVLFKI